MGIALIHIEGLERAGVFKNGMNVLDMGTSYLHGATLERMEAFIKKYPGRPLTSEDRTRMEDISRRSLIAPGVSEAYLGEFLELTGIGYQAIDILDMPYTRIIDLNAEELPADMKGAFDVVLNCGTTEHILNQFNAFQVMHDALKPGGHFYHMLPTSGFFDHGYFSYHPRFFVEMAAANGYRLRQLYFSGPQDFGKFEEQYQLPALLDDQKGFKETRADLGQYMANTPNGLIMTVMRKTKDEAFRPGLDLSSPGGPLSSRIASLYHVPNAKGSLFRRAARKVKRIIVSFLGNRKAG